MALLVIWMSGLGVVLRGQDLGFGANGLVTHQPARSQSRGLFYQNRA